MKTKVVIVIDHPDDLRIDKCDIEEAFLESGDVDWTTEVVSIEPETSAS